jgi:hypothetical protein
LDSTLNDIPLHIKIARSFIGTKELKNNRGYWIDKWNKNVNAPLGSPYCGAFGYYCLDSAKVIYPQKKSGLARSHVNKSSFTILDVLNHRKSIKIGDGLIWQKNNSYQGHFGFANENWNGNSGSTIEANTSGIKKENQSEGDGVYFKSRRIEPYNYHFRIRWITPYSSYENAD